MSQPEAIKLLNAQTLAELRSLCERVKLNITGRKAQLIDRLVSSDAVRVVGPLDGTRTVELTQEALDKAKADTRQRRGRPRKSENKADAPSDTAGAAGARADAGDSETPRGGGSDDVPEPPAMPPGPTEDRAALPDVSGLFQPQPPNVQGQPSSPGPAGSPLPDAQGQPTPYPTLLSRAPQPSLARDPSLANSRAAFALPPLGLFPFASVADGPPPNLPTQASRALNLSDMAAAGLGPASAAASGAAAAAAAVGVDRFGPQPELPFGHQGLQNAATGAAPGGMADPGAAMPTVAGRRGSNADAPFHGFSNPAPAPAAPPAPDPGVERRKSSTWTVQEQQQELAQILELPPRIRAVVIVPLEEAVAEEEPDPGALRRASGAQAACMPGADVGHGYAEEPQGWVDVRLSPSRIYTLPPPYHFLLVEDPPLPPAGAPTAKARAEPAAPSGAAPRRAQSAQLGSMRPPEVPEGTASAPDAQQRAGLPRQRPTTVGRPRSRGRDLCTEQGLPRSESAPGGLGGLGPGVGVREVPEGSAQHLSGSHPGRRKRPRPNKAPASATDLPLGPPLDSRGTDAAFGGARSAADHAAAATAAAAAEQPRVKRIRKEALRGRSPAQAPFPTMTVGLLEMQTVPVPSGPSAPSPAPHMDIWGSRAATPESYVEPQGAGGSDAVSDRSQSVHPQPHAHGTDDRSQKAPSPWLSAQSAPPGGAIGAGAYDGAAPGGGPSGAAAAASAAHAAAARGNGAAVATTEPRALPFLTPLSYPQAHPAHAGHGGFFCLPPSLGIPPGVGVGGQHDTGMPAPQRAADAFSIPFEFPPSGSASFPSSGPGSLGGALETLLHHELGHGLAPASAPHAQRPLDASVGAGPGGPGWGIPPAPGHGGAAAAASAAAGGGGARGGPFEPPRSGLGRPWGHPSARIQDPQYDQERSQAWLGYGYGPGPASGPIAGPGHGHGLDFHTAALLGLVQNMAGLGPGARGGLPPGFGTDSSGFGSLPGHLSGARTQLPPQQQPMPRGGAGGGSGNGGGGGWPWPGPGSGPGSDNVPEAAAPLNLQPGEYRRLMDLLNTEPLEVARLTADSTEGGGIHEARRQGPGLAPTIGHGPATAGKPGRPEGRDLDLLEAPPFGYGSQGTAQVQGTQQAQQGFAAGFDFASPTAEGRGWTAAVSGSGSLRPMFSGERGSGQQAHAPQPSPGPMQLGTGYNPSDSGPVGVWSPLLGPEPGRPGGVLPAPGSGSAGSPEMLVQGGGGGLSAGQGPSEHPASGSPLALPPSTAMGRGRRGQGARG